MITRTKLISVWVSDQDKAYDFYVNKLGFKVETDQTMPNGFRWLEVVPPGAETATSGQLCRSGTGNTLALLPRRNHGSPRSHNVWTNPCQDPEDPIRSSTNRPGRNAWLDG